MRLLLTGANGFIGKNLYELLSHDYDVTAVGRNELDLTDEQAVADFLKFQKFDIVLHAANVNSSRGDIVTPYEVLQGNLKMFYNLVRHSDLYKRLLYFGSGAEFDKDHYIPKMSEQYFGSSIPSDPYGLSKYIMAREAFQYSNVFNLRLFGVFGKYEEWTHRFISNAICRALFNQPITIHQNVFFDYICVEDLSRILPFFFEKELNYKHYNICRGNTVDLLTLANMVKKQTKAEVPIIVESEGLKSEYSGNNSRMLSLTGDYKFTPFEESINMLIDFYRDTLSAGDIERL